MKSRIQNLIFSLSLQTFIVGMLFVMLSADEALAQVPHLFNYQGIARDANGTPLGNKTLSLKLSILAASDAAAAEYEETQTVKTNEFGLYTLQIGNGTPLSGQIKTVQWETGNKYIKVAIDPDGGSNYIYAGTNQLLSVPYAIYADKAGEANNNRDKTRTGVVNSNAAHNANDANYITKFTSFNTIGRSLMYDNGATVSVGGNVDLNGVIRIAGGSPGAGRVLTSDAAGNASWQSAVGWSTSGNAGTNAAINFIGTTDNTDLVFKRNNVRAGLLNINNTAFGIAALNPLSTGAYNTATGFASLYSNTTGYNSTATGYYALFSNTSGFQNTANGYKALFSNTTGYYNTATGSLSLYYNTTGNQNTANGIVSLYSNTTGDYNTANGYGALYSNTTGVYNTANGFGALFLSTTGVNNTANGVRAMHYNTTGYNNTATGYESLLSNTTGYYNTANGYESLYGNTTGAYNSANGYATLRTNTTGYNNTANGYTALYSNQTGAYNTANAVRSLYSNVSGIMNTAVGYNSMFGNISGHYNTAVGTRSLDSNSTGYYNTALGYWAMHTNKTGSNNTGVGYLTDVSSGNLDNATAIGYNAIVDASNKVRVGNTNVTSIGGQVGWTTFSDARYKQNIQEDVKGLDFIMKLRPVTYTVDVKSIDKKYGVPDSIQREKNYDNAQTRQTGFLAQEVEKSANDLGYNFSGVDKPQNSDALYGIRYAEFVVPLTKAVQEQQEIINQQEATIQQQQDAIKSLEQRLKAIEDKLK